MSEEWESVRLWHGGSVSEPARVCNKIRGHKDVHTLNALLTDSSASLLFGRGLEKDDHVVAQDAY